MKKTLFLFPILLLGAILISSFSLPTPNTSSKTPYALKDEADGITIKYPKKVDAIIQAKCYGCHSPEGKAQKALNWDDLASMPKVKLIKKLGSIAAVVEEGSMPPSSLLKRMPEKALTDKEVKKLVKWTKKMQKKAMK